MNVVHSCWLAFFSTFIKLAALLMFCYILLLDDILVLTLSCSNRLWRRGERKKEDLASQEAYLSVRRDGVGRAV